ncbi:MAG TPA: hypothetical protein VEL76_09005 [Gemmataceae bacterium]|nr:hypothetical protein [Gemmataceae bacterium]
MTLPLAQDGPDARIVDNLHVPLPFPVTDPPNHESEEPVSFAGLSFEGGGLTLWCDPGTTMVESPQSEIQLQLQPGKPVVIGRQQGGRVPYLDPAYTPTRVLPDTNRSVLTMAGDGKDITVSRGHFLLRATAEGLLLLNGVPRRGGGVRPPLNGTWLLEPERRPLGDGEEYLIATGSSARIRLPNGAKVRIRGA